MGCGSSKNALSHVDDSVHVMLKHDKKVQQKKGAAPAGYKERAAHPLLKPKELPKPISSTPNPAAEAPPAEN